MDMHYPYQLPPLPYAYEALSPNISGDTLHFHHDKHFQTYVDNLNTALADCPECQSKPLDELLKNKTAELMQDSTMDARIFALKMVEYLHDLWSDQNPVVVVYYSPPYYPHIYVKNESDLEQKLMSTLEKVLKNNDSKYDVAIKKFYPYISDLSYAAAPREANAIESLKNNMPGWGLKYELPIAAMQKLNLPVVNIGPFGKDAHKYTERLEKDYSFNVAPKLVYDTIIGLLS